MDAQSNKLVVFLDHDIASRSAAENRLLVSVAQTHECKNCFVLSGYHFLTLSVPRRSLLKLSIGVPQGSAPHMIVYPEGQPQSILAEAYGDLFMGMFVPEGLLYSFQSCKHFVTKQMKILPSAPVCCQRTRSLAVDNSDEVLLRAYSPWKPMARSADT